MKRLLIVFGILLSSCATIPHSQTMDGRLDGLLGDPYHQAVVEFGPPTDIYSDSNEGRILHYDYSTERTVPALSYSTANFNGGIWATSITRPPQTIRDDRYIQLYVRPDSTIYHYRYQGVQTNAEEDMKRTNKTLSTIYWTAGVTGFFVAIMAASE